MKTQMVLSLIAILSAACAKTSEGSAPIYTPTAPIPTAVFTVPALTSTSIPKVFCQPTSYPQTIHFVNSDAFGDGYISHTLIKDVAQNSKEEIVVILVTQWLEHYKTQSQSSSATIKDYLVGTVNLSKLTSCDPFFEIVAGVRFSIIPNQIPNDYASFPGDPINPDDIWWRLAAPFGVFRDGDSFRLRLVFGWGT